MGPRGEPALDAALAQHLPGAHRPVDALELVQAEIATLERLAEQRLGLLADHHAAGWRHALEACGEVRRRPHDGIRLRAAFGDDVADHDEAGGSGDADLELGGTAGEAALDGFGDGEAGAAGPCRIVLMRARVAEIGDDAVAGEPAHHTFALADQARADLAVAAYELAIVFGVEALREARRSDQVAEHDGEMASLGGDDRRWRRIRNALIETRSASAAEARARRVRAATRGALPWLLLRHPDHCFPKRRRLRRSGGRPSCSTATALITLSQPRPSASLDAAGGSAGALASPAGRGRLDTGGRGASGMEKAAPFGAAFECSVGAAAVVFRQFSPDQRQPRRNVIPVPGTTAASRT